MEYKLIFIIFIFAFVIANKYLFDKIKGDVKKLLKLNGIEGSVEKYKPKPRSLIWIIKNVYLEFIKDNTILR
jgi:hypothetical protein